MFRQVLFLALLFTAAATVAEPPAFDSSTLGVSFSDLPELKEDASFKWPTARGVLVHDSIAGIEPEESLLSKFDVVYQIGDTRIDDATSAIKAIRAVPIGQEVSVRYYDAQLVKGRLKWRKKAAKITTMSYSDYLTKRYERKRDEVTGAESLYPSGTDHTVNDGTELSGFVAKVSAKYVPCLYVEYVADDWLFVKEVAFIVDGGESIVIDANSMKTDHNGGRIWEWGRIPISDPGKATALHKALLEGRVSSAILIGSQYRRELDIDEWSAYSIRNAFELCRLLNKE